MNIFIAWMVLRNLRVAGVLPRTLLFAFLLAPWLAQAQPQFQSVFTVATANREITGSPAVDSNGNVYFGSLDGRVRAISSSLSWASLWNVNLGAEITAAPAFTHDGNLLVAGYEPPPVNQSRLWVLRSSDGAYVRGTTIRGRIVTSPAVAANGTVYVVEFNTGQLYALNPQLTQTSWAFTAPPSDRDFPVFLTASPIIGADGTIYVGSFNRRLYALNPTDGSIKWRFRANGALRSAPALDLDGTLYFTASAPDDRLYAVNPDGTEKWRFTLPQTGELQSSPAIGADGLIYFGAMNSFFCIDRKGVQQWKVDVDKEVWSSPAVAADGTAYFGTLRGTVYAVRGGSILAQSTVPEVGQAFTPIIASPTILGDDQGTMLLGASDGVMRGYRRAPGRNPLADSPWPKARGSLTQQAQAPYQIALTSPLDGRTFKAPAQIELKATAYAIAGVNNVAFRTVTAIVGNDNQAPYEFLWSNMPVGDYQLRARVETPTGVKDSLPVNIVVNNLGIEPFIEPIADQQTRKDEPLTINFRVEDVLNPAAELDVAVFSSNAQVLPDSNLTLSPTGKVRSLTMSPLKNRTGDTIIRIEATSRQPNGGSSTNSFHLTVVPFNYPPQVTPDPFDPESDFTDLEWAQGRKVVLENTGYVWGAVVAYDPEDGGSVIPSSFSSDETLLPPGIPGIPGSIQFSTDGDGFFRFSLKPAPNKFGTAIVTLTFTDQGGKSASLTFVLEVLSVNSPPQLLQPIPPQEGMAGAPKAIPFTIVDIDTPVSNIVATARATDTNAIPATNFVFSGTGTNRILTVTPAITVTNTTTNTIFLTLRDLTDTNSSSADFFTFKILPRPDAPRILEQPLSQVVRVTETVEFRVVATGAEPLEYQWFFNGTTLLFGETDPFLRLTNVQTNDNGRYSVRVSGPGGEVTSNDATLEVVEPPIILSAPPTNIVQVVGSEVVLTVLAKDPSGRGIEYYWFFGTNQNALFIGNTLRLTNLQLANAGFYTCLVSNTVGAFRIAPTNGPINLRVVAPPVITPIAAAVNEDTPFVDLPFATITDPDTDPSRLEATARSLDTTILNNANLTWKVSNGRVLLSGITVANAFGSVPIEIVAFDDFLNRATNVSTLTVRAVNDPPTLDPIPDVVLPERTTSHVVQLSGITSGAPNELDSLIITATSSNPALIPHPQRNYTWPATTGSLTLNPVPNVGGVATITVTVNDGQPANAVFTRTFRVTVNDVNDPPQFVGLRSPLEAPRNRLTEIPFTIFDDETPNGPFTLPSAISLDPFTTLGITGSGTNYLLRIQPSGATPASAQIALSTRDPGGVPGTLNLEVRVLTVNEPPTLNPLPPLNLREDDPEQTVTLTGISAGAGESQVVTISAETDKTDLITGLSVSPVNPTGSTSTLRFRPGPNRFGSAIITVFVTDNGTPVREAKQSFTVTVESVNDLPTFSGLQPLTLLEGVAGTLNFQVADIETPAAILIVSPLTLSPDLLPQSGLTTGGSGASRSLTVQPAANKSGTGAVRLTLADGDGGQTTADITVVVQAVNDRPIANALSVSTPEDTPRSITLTASDPDGDPLTFESVDRPARGRLAGDPPNLVYLPDTNYFGIDSFTFRVSDGLTNSLPATVTITVEAVNDPPSISSIPSQSILPGESTASLPFTIADPDSGDFLTVSATSDNQALVPDDFIFLGGVGTNRTVRVFPLPNTAGVARITVRVSDGQASASTTFTLSVEGEVPVIVTQPQSQSVRVGEAARFEVAASGSPPLRYQWQLNGQPLPGETNAVLAIAAAANTDAGSYSVTVSNPAGAATSAEALLTVLSDRAPSVTMTFPAPGSRFVAPATIPLLAAATDPDGFVARVEFFDGLSNKVGQSTVSPFRADWANLDVGSYSVWARATDNSGLTTESAPVQFTVENPPANLPSVDISDVFVIEGDPGTTTKFTFTLRLSAPVDTEVSVVCATADGTATAGEDYAAVRQTVRFSPRQTEATLEVTVFGDASREITLESQEDEIPPSETFFVNLIGVTNAVLARFQGVGYIIEDELPILVSIGPLSQEITEGDSGTSPATVKVALSDANSVDVRISYLTVDGTAKAGVDYVETSGVLIIPAGDLEADIAIPIIGDREPEVELKEFSIRLNQVFNAFAAIDQAQIIIRDNDSLPTLTPLSVVVPEGNETRNQALRVTLDLEAPRPISLRFATANGTAVAGSDYLSTNGVVAIPAGALEATFNVVVLGDGSDEPDETFFVDFVAPPEALLATNRISVTLRNDDEPPVVALQSLQVQEGAAGQTTANLVLSLSEPSGYAVTVDYASIDGTATAGIDYLPVQGTVTLPPGVQSTNLPLIILGDLLNEPDETFVVRATKATRATLDEQLSSALVTIINDDSPVRVVPGAAAYTVREGSGTNSTLVIPVSLSEASGQPVSVNYQTFDSSARAGSDYTTAIGTLNFPVGERERSITLTILGDSAHEADEIFLVRFSGVQNATLPQPEVVVTIQDDDLPPFVLLSPLRVVEGNAGTTTNLAALRLSEVSGLDAVVGYATADGTARAGQDYVAAVGQVTIPAGSLTAQIPLIIIGDMIDEPDEQFSLYLTNAVRARIDPTNSPTVITIANDDAGGGLSIDSLVIDEGNSGNRTINLPVRLSAASGRTVTVNYQTIDGTARAGSDYLGVTNQLSFASGTQVQNIPLVIVGDTLYEADETFIVRLSNPQNAELLQAEATVTLRNDDLAPLLSVAPRFVLEGNAGLTRTNVLLQLNAISGLDVEVNYLTADGSARAGLDYVAAAGTMRIPAGIRSTNLPVDIIGDTLDETNETFFVRLTNAIGAVISQGESTVTIFDDDQSPALSIAPASVAEGNSGRRDLIFRVTLSAPSGLPISVGFATVEGTASAGSDYVARSGRVEFAPGSTNATIAIEVIGDTVHESDERFTVTLSDPVNASLATALAQGTILNDDADAPKGPTIAPVGDRETNEDTPLGPIALLLADPDTPVANLVLSATSTNTTLFPAGSITFGTSGTNRTVTLAPARDQTGTTAVTITVSDGTQSASTTFRVVVKPTNDPPTISPNPIPAQTTDGAAPLPPVTVRLADPDSPIDRVTLTATSSDQAILANGNISITGTGADRTIRMTVPSDVTGTAIVTLTATDDQGASTKTEFLVGVRVIPPRILSNPQDQSALAGATVTFRVSASGTPPLQYQWSFNGLEMAGATRDTLTLTNVQLANAGSYSVLVRNPAGAGSSTPAVLTVIPLAVISVRDVEGPEGTGQTNSLVFTLTLSRASETAVTVGYATQDETALAGADYVPRSGTITFRPGERTQTVRVDLVPDAQSEADETFVLRLSDPVGATLSTTRVRGTILNDDGNSAPRLEVRSVDTLQFKLAVLGEAGRTYAVQVSEDLARWTVVQTGVPSGSEVAVPINPNRRVQFYRAAGEL
jgi:outer membrane protein assembly factor BamB